MKLLRQQDKFIIVNFRLVLCHHSPAARRHSIAFELRLHFFPRSKGRWNVSLNFRINHCMTIRDTNNFFCQQRRSGSKNINNIFELHSVLILHMKAVSLPKSTVFFFTEVRLPSYSLQSNLQSCSASPQQAGTKAAIPSFHESVSATRKDDDFHRQ